METSNPFASPQIVVEEVSPGARRPTLKIRPFRLDAKDMKSGTLTPAQPVGLIEDKLAEHCRNLGFELVDQDADYELEGRFLRIDEGDRWIRFLCTWLMGIFAAIFKFGAVHVAVTGRLFHDGTLVGTFDFQRHKSVGIVFGDNGERAIRRFVQGMAWDITTHVGRLTGRVQGQRSEDVSRYFGVLKLVAASLALAIAGGLLIWALGQPVRKDGIETVWGKCAWSGFNFVCFYLAVYLIGTGFAPQAVLEDASMMKFRAYSGVSTTMGLRVVLILLLFGPLGLFGLFLMAL